jgi:hypothetical protein
MFNSNFNLVIYIRSIQYTSDTSHEMFDNTSLIYLPIIEFYHTDYRISMKKFINKIKKFIRYGIVV